MTTQFYHQQFDIPDLSFTAQNSIALAPNFHAFVCDAFQNNSEGETSAIELTFPISTFSSSVLNDIASKAYTVAVTAYKSDPFAVIPLIDWTFTGIITNVANSLTTIDLTVGTPLQPVGSGEAPGMVPFRSARSDQVGTLPITGR